jgi:hypothetical protein
VVPSAVRSRSVLLVISWSASVGAQPGELTRLSPQPWVVGAAGLSTRQGRRWSHMTYHEFEAAGSRFVTCPASPPSAMNVYPPSKSGMSRISRDIGYSPNQEFPGRDDARLRRRERRSQLVAANAAGGHQRQHRPPPPSVGSLQ